MTWWFNDVAFARGAAQRRARQAGQRMRVTRDSVTGRWLVYPTPAPGPSRLAVEPCS